MSIKRGEVEFSPGFQVQNTNGLFSGGEDPEYIAHREGIVFFARWLASRVINQVLFISEPRRREAKNIFKYEKAWTGLY